MTNKRFAHLERLGLHVFERGWLSANNILCLDSSDLHTTVVDTGYGTHAEQTVSLVQSVLKDRPLNHILNTHLHSDHCGGNAALQAAYPLASTRIPPGEAEAVRVWDETVLSYEVTGQMCPRFTFHTLLQPNTTVRLGIAQWQVLAAPGHDPSSIILFEPITKTLISADALWQNGFGVVFPELTGESGFAEVKATLDVIAGLDIQTVIPGHGAVFGNTSDAPTTVAASLDMAYKRLASFVENPAKHAKYAAKVLLKYKLLEWQRIAIPELQRWASAVPYFATIAAQHFGATSLTRLIADLVDELTNSGAAKREGEILVNV